MRISSRSLLPFILLAAFALRMYRLGAASLWYDETVSAFLARQDLVALTQHTAGDIHPPLYYYVLHFWGQVAGWSQFAFAFVSLFFDILLIALVYRVAREWLISTPFPSPVAREKGEGVGVLAALLVAASPYNLWYSQEVRMYTMGALLGLASTYFFVRMFSRPSPVASRQKILPRDLVAYAVVSALGMYTLYYFAFLLVFQNLAALVWIFRPSPRASRNSHITFYVLRQWFFSQIAILILYLPWLPIAFRQATDPPVPPWRSFTALPNVLGESFSALSLGQSLDPALTWPILFFIAVLIVIALWHGNHPITQPPNHLTSGVFLLGYTFVPVLVIFLLSLWKPLYHVRYVFLYSPAFYILWALGLARVFSLKIDFRKYATAIFAGGALLAAAIGYSDYNFWFDPRYAHDDLRDAVHYLTQHWRPGDAILINAGYTYTAFDYYSDLPVAWRGRLIDYPPNDASLGTPPHSIDPRAGASVLETGSIGGSPSLGWGSHASDFYATTADETRAALDRVFALHPRVWMLRLYDTVVDPNGVIRDYLATYGRIIDSQGFAGESFPLVEGYLTARAPLTALPDTATRRDVLLSGRIALLGFAPAHATVRAGAPLDVDVYWQAQQPTNIDEHLYVGLFAADGKPVASTDDVPLGNALGTSRWTPGEILREPVRLIVPPSVAPGTYVLRVAMYNPLTNEPLAAPPGEWVGANDQVVLTAVRVEQ
jgi:mannosyltransferase